MCETKQVNQLAASHPSGPRQSEDLSNQRFPAAGTACKKNQTLVTVAGQANSTDSPGQSQLTSLRVVQLGAVNPQEADSPTCSDTDSGGLVTTIDTKASPDKVHHRNPRAGLPDGVSPLARAEQKLLAALSYVLLWHFTTARQLAIACKFDLGFPGELVKRGFLKKVSTEFLKCGEVLMLSASGVERALECQPVAVAYNLRSDSLISCQRHHLAVQRVTQALSPETYLPERLIGLVDRSGEKKPDLIATMTDGRVIFVEVELTPKAGGRELDQALLKVVRALETGRCTSVYYFSHNATLLKNYAEMLKKEITVWEFRNARWSAAGKRTVATEVQSRIHFKLVKNLVVNL